MSVYIPNKNYRFSPKESGRDKVLADIKKGVTQEQILVAADRIKQAGIEFNGGVILGLGGVKDSEEHIRESIKVINQMKPPLLGALVLNPQPGTPLYDDVMSGKFELPTYRDILREERELLEGISDDYPLHVWAGGFLPGAGVITGNFPEDRDRVMKAISERQITNRLLDQKIMVSGRL